MTIKEKFKRGKNFFDSGKTFDYAFRIDSLSRLERAIKEHREAVFTALQNDLNKSSYESFVTEYGMVLGELSLVKKKLKKWMKPKKPMASLLQMPAKTRIYSQPYGLVLIISPWNYPFYLGMIPVISAIAAGNAVILKPSEYSTSTSAVMETILNEVFEEGCVQVVQGGKEETQELLLEPFDYIFFTGSPVVGKIVMEKASQHLTPITLELGGKSPCIITEDAVLKMAAKRIAFGKLLNAGQICVAPDYLLVDEKINDSLVEALIEAEKGMLSSEEYASENFVKIISQRRFDHLENMLKGQEIFYQSTLYDSAKGQFPFTILKNPSVDSAVMTEEIFGPILPVITYKNIEEAFEFVKRRPNPLALYMFTENKAIKKRVVRELQFGGGCINDTILHIASHRLPFGGIGYSGMGRYHGKCGFETFSYQKSVLEKWKSFDMPMRYQPYKKGRKSLPLFLFKK